MSTFYKRDGVELDQLIAGDDATWDNLKLDWDDRLVVHCQQNLEHDNADGLVDETWNHVQRAVMRWRPGVDTRKDADGNPVLIDRALTLNYVKTALTRRAQADKVRQHKLGALVGSLDAPIDEEGATQAALVPDFADRGVPKEIQLFALVSDLETKRLGDEEVAIALVQTLLDEGLLLARALEWFIHLADPALDEVHKQVFIRRWLLSQTFCQIGQDLAGIGEKEAAPKATKNKELANWASNQHQAALKRIRNGLARAKGG
jgi:hypothetical protein